MELKENKELQEVENQLKLEKSRRMFQRYQTVRLYLLGHNSQQIATIIGRSERTVRTYYNAIRIPGYKDCKSNSPRGEVSG